MPKPEDSAETAMWESGKRPGSPAVSAPEEPQPAGVRLQRAMDELVQLFGARQGGKATAARLVREIHDAAFERGKAEGIAEGRRLAAETLRSAAAGRRTYAENAGVTAGILEAEAWLLDQAADAAGGDLRPMYGWLPSWQWTPEMNAAAGGSDA